MEKPNIGAHVSISGGYGVALEKLATMGGTCMQIFSSSPRGWNTVAVDGQTAAAFRKKGEELHVSPVYFHASYLINLADDGDIGFKSKKSLIAELTSASKMGIRGSIVHLGSYKKEENGDKFNILVANMREILAKTPSDTLFIVENAGNRKIGQNIREIKTIADAVRSDRLRVCLDSCHLYSAGYPLDTQDRINTFLAEFEKAIGLDRLEVWHLNDSKDPLDSGRDRHENIGQGTIGLQEFRLILNHPKLASMPFIIETPGFDDKGPDKKNIDILKNLYGNK